MANSLIISESACSHLKITFSAFVAGALECSDAGTAEDDMQHLEPRLGAAGGAHARLQQPSCSDSL